MVLTISQQLLLKKCCPSLTNSFLQPKIIKQLQITLSKVKSLINIAMGISHWMKQTELLRNMRTVFLLKGQKLIRQLICLVLISKTKWAKFYKVPWYLMRKVHPMANLESFRTLIPSKMSYMLHQNQVLMAVVAAIPFLNKGIEVWGHLIRRVNSKFNLSLIIGTTRLQVKSNILEI